MSRKADRIWRCLLLIRRVDKVLLHFIFLTSCPSTRPMCTHFIQYVTSCANIEKMCHFCPIQNKQFLEAACRIACIHANRIKYRPWSAFVPPGHCGTPTASLAKQRLVSLTQYVSIAWQAIAVSLAASRCSPSCHGSHLRLCLLSGVALVM